MKAEDFCSQCNNFLFTIEERTVEGKRKAYHKCRSCPFEREVDTVVYEHNLRQDTSVQHSINPFLKYASDLPRFTTMICRNGDCPTQGQASNIVGIKLDPINVSWFYRCAVCNETWTQLARG